MVGGNLTVEQLQNVVDKTINDFDEDKDGKLSFEEFEKVFVKVEGLNEKLEIKDDWWVPNTFEEETKEDEE
jgi:hypothetical protein